MNKFFSICVLRILALAIAATSCSQFQGVYSAQAPERMAGAHPPFKESCIHFESLLFGEKVASSLSGHTLVENELAFEALQDVQVAARSLATGEIRYTVSNPDGSYEVGSLAEGQYDVWTCLDGFDELRFLLTIDQTSTYSGIELHLRASEAGAGSVAVVPTRRD